MQTITITNDTWLDYALSLPAPLVDELHVICDGHGEFGRQEPGSAILLATIKYAFPNLTRLVWEENDIQDINEIIMCDYPNIEIITKTPGQVYSHPIGLIRTICGLSIQSEHEIPAVTSDEVIQEIDSYEIVPSEIAGDYPTVHCIDEIFWEPLIHILIQSPINENITALHVDFIDRGIMDGLVLAELLHNRFPKLTYFGFAESFSCDLHVFLSNTKWIKNIQITDCDQDEGIVNSAGRWYTSV